MLGAIFAYLMLIRWWRKEREIYRTEWKIKYEDLEFNSTAASVSTSQETAKLKEETVVVKRLKKKTVIEDRSLTKEMVLIKSLKHRNLANFIGACPEQGKLLSLWEHCVHGTLEEVLDHANLKLESKRFSVAMDVCLGLQYLHNSTELGYHGRLKTTNCLVDSQWVIKLSDFGMAKLRKGEDQGGNFESDNFCQGFLWTAPERLRCILDKKPQKLTKESDIFSLGVVLKQVFSGKGVYKENSESPKDVIQRIAYPDLGKSLTRPETDCVHKKNRRAIGPDLCQLIKNCWAEDPTERPKVHEVFKKLRRLRPRKKTCSYNETPSFVERYSSQLWEVLTDQICHGSAPSRETGRVPLDVFPRVINCNIEQAKVYSGATICFYNISDFASLVYQSSPKEIVKTFDQLQKHINVLIQNSGVCSVETIDDASMLASGCPVSNDLHASLAADLALALLHSMDSFTIPHLPWEKLKVRMGLHSGPVVAGLVGKAVPRFCLFGQTVDIASRLEMEVQDCAQRILVSEETFHLLKNHDRFYMEQRGAIETKGKGSMMTYWLKQSEDGIALS